jgi:hypothetical protein
MSIGRPFYRFSDAQGIDGCTLESMLPLEEKTVERITLSFGVRFRVGPIQIELFPPGGDEPPTQPEEYGR